MRVEAEMDGNDLYSSTRPLNKYQFFSTSIPINIYAPERDSAFAPLVPLHEEMPSDNPHHVNQDLNNPIETAQYLPTSNPKYAEAPTVKYN